MTSTYSTSLRLELMATGDQSGTWGDTTNTNLGTLLEQAITGVLSVAEGDATLTLTASNGASDQARNMVVNLTGAMTANRNVVVPTANKVYFVKNSTTGGYTVTVKTSGGTGVEIPPGTARWVYCDATNVVDAYSGPFTPSTNDGAALGLSAVAWSDLFLASGGVVNWNAGDVTITHSANTLAFAGASSGYTFDAAPLPSANDAAALGASGTAWADLFLASGGVINWNAGDVTITHSANTLAFAGASSGYTYDAVVKPSSNDGAALGASGTAWSDLFLASGSVINWNAGDATLTHSSNTLVLAGATLYMNGGGGATIRAYFDSLGLGEIGLVTKSDLADLRTAAAFFNNSAVQVGSITVSVVATAYNTSSDRRLKTELRDFDSGAIIDALVVGQFDWLNMPGETGYGVIAQDAYEVFPQMITKGETEDSMWSADYSKLVPVHHRELQQMRDRVSDLENAVLVLSQRIASLEMA